MPSALTRADSTGCEEFLHCVRAAGFATNGAATGRACGLRPAPPCVPHVTLPVTATCKP